MWILELEWTEAASKHEDEGHTLKVAKWKDKGAWVSDCIVEPSDESWNGELWTFFFFTIFIIINVNLDSAVAAV